MKELAEKIGEILVSDNPIKSNELMKLLVGISSTDWYELKLEFSNLTNPQLKIREGLKEWLQWELTKDDFYLIRKTIYRYRQSKAAARDLAIKYNCTAGNTVKFVFARRIHNCSTVKNNCYGQGYIYFS